MSMFASLITPRLPPKRRGGGPAPGRAMDLPPDASRLENANRFRGEYRIRNIRWSGHFGEVRLQLADDLVPQFLRQIVGHSVDQHKPRALDGAGDGAPA